MRGARRRKIKTKGCPPKKQGGRYKTKSNSEALAAEKREIRKQ